ncbi:T9SS type A sorting domain-containing protein [Reichenbachiella carrageenanivorans]|uniref:T9SS type A sorting domain-containing protein n=1 Tax=Reichenbachiella carrageenanivorans TaxID=2979869 RepID=A0ABY6D5I2_9BACT|nr:T9SS type A sorting domain-containing protein [Reichenbachiella carrageenanivorans]UXX81368.1 T9SS type A sorting domain-containing protein [Reichenbachiella carrageenanivorans]
MYPNPTSDWLAIQPTSGMDQGSYQLVNSLGIIVLQESAVDFSTKKTIELNSLSNGVYLLIIKLDNKPIGKHYLYTAIEFVQEELIDTLINYFCYSK